MKGLPGPAWIVLALAVLLWGCTGSSRPSDTGVDPGDPVGASSAPTDFVWEPSIRGTITAVEGATLRVEEEPDEQSGSAKAMVRVNTETAIRTVDGTAATAAQLTVGATVTVWFSGPVAESYPVQAAAGAIELGQRTDAR